MAAPRVTQAEAAAELLRRRAVRRSLTEFAIEQGFTPAAHHKLLIAELEGLVDEGNDIDLLLVEMPPGSAKALALDTPIPTPSGWTTMGELKVGQEVFDESGKPCTVTWKSPVWRDRPVYKVLTDCGDEIVADRDHEWRVRLCGKPRKLKTTECHGPATRSDRDDPASRFKIKETWELHRRRAKRPMIERAKPLDLPQVRLPIDPYLLGVWLGDGHSAGTRITSSVEDQPWLRGELERLGYRTSDSSQPTLFGVLGVRDKFVSLGLINDPFHGVYGRKYVPGVYWRASKDQRLSLLQGLIDTDGTVCRTRGCTTFCNTNLELAESVRELVRSLGVKAGWSESRAMLNGKDCGPAYKVSFYLAKSARMPRKVALCRDQQRTPNTYISTETTHIADTVCIEVNSPSHLFLCGRSMTPTHNSTYINYLFPAWFLARNPKSDILTASHSSELAERWGRRTRNLISNASNLLGTDLSAGSGAAYRWATSEGGEYYAVGVGVGIMGFRAGLGLIDDPVGSREDAESKRVRDKIWEWYVNDFSSRLRPGAKRVIMHQRFHEDDLAGRIIKQFDQIRKPYRRLKIRAESIGPEDDPLGRPAGEMLWDDPAGYDYGRFLRDRKAEMVGDPRGWSALFQQEPIPDTGDYFRREWLIPVDVIPPKDSLRIYGGSDYAVSSGKGDYTVHSVVGIDSDGNPWLVDLWRQQSSSDAWVSAFCDLVRKWNPMGWAEEQGQIRSGVGPFLEKEMNARQAYVVREQFPTRGAKGVRAQSFRALIATKGLRIPATAPWRTDVESELLRFPVGVHDDVVDSLGLIGQLVAKMIDAAPPMKERRVVRDHYRSETAQNEWDALTI